jgi:hypothetical protein
MNCHSNRSVICTTMVLYNVKRYININNIYYFLSPPLSFSILSLLFHVSFIHPIFLPSSFSISPRYFPSLSLISPPSIPHVLDRLSLLVAHPAPSLLSFRPIYLLSLSSFPHLNLAIIFLSLALSVHRSFGISFFTHLSYSLLYLGSLILSLLSCLAVSLSLSLRIHPYSFCSQFFHFLTGIPVPPVVLLSLLVIRVLFFSLQHSVSILHFSLSLIFSSNFAALFPAFTLSLFLLQSSLYYVTWRFSVHS